VGLLTVVASVDRVLARITDRVMVILASNAIKTFLVGAFALVLFHFMITRHLQRIAEHATEFDPDQGPPQPLTLARGQARDAAPDSIDGLESALNQMNARLANERERVIQSERRFRNLVDGSLQGVVLNDGQRFVYANDAATKLLTVTRARG
jgi:PAS domain-containing protein